MRRTGLLIVILWLGVHCATAPALASVETRVQEYESIARTPKDPPPKVRQPKRDQKQLEKLYEKAAKNAGMTTEEYKKQIAQHTDENPPPKVRQSKRDQKKLKKLYEKAAKNAGMTKEEWKKHMDKLTELVGLQAKVQKCVMEKSGKELKILNEADREKFFNERLDEIIQECKQAKGFRVFHKE